MVLIHKYLKTDNIEYRSNFKTKIFTDVKYWGCFLIAMLFDAFRCEERGQGRFGN